MATGGKGFDDTAAQPTTTRQKAKGDFPTGYECEFVEPPPDILATECSICLHIPREPHLVSCCGQHFCKSCIERTWSENKPCPLCNQPDFTATLDKSVQRHLNALKVYCMNRRKGCEWVGELGHLDHHLNDTPRSGGELIGCEFVELSCIYGCGGRFQRCYLMEHHNKCPSRPFSCEYCSYSSTYQDVVHNHWPVCRRYPLQCPNNCEDSPIERQNFVDHKTTCPIRPFSCEYCNHLSTYRDVVDNHWPECPQYPLQCPNSSEDSPIERQLLEDHLQKECPLGNVNCEFQFAGCTVQVERRDLAAHMRDNLPQHISQLSSTTRILAADIRDEIQQKFEQQTTISKDQIEQCQLQKLERMIKTASDNTQQQTQTSLQHTKTSLSQCGMIMAATILAFVAVLAAVIVMQHQLIQRLQHDHTEATELIQQLREGHIETTEHFQQLQQGHIETTEHIQQLRQDDTEASEHIQQLRKGRIEATEHIQQLREGHTETTKHIEQLQQGHIETTEHIQQLRQDHIEATEQLLQHHNEATEHIQQLREGHIETTKHIEQLQQGRIETTEHIQQLRQDDIEATEHIQHLQQSHTEATEHIQQLQQDHTEAIEEISDDLQYLQLQLHHAPELVSPSLCTAEGPGLHSPTVDITTEVTVSVIDILGWAYSERHVKVTAEIESDGSITPANVFCVESSKCHVTYTPRVRGWSRLYVKVNNGNIKGSPFSIHVSPEVTEEIGELNGPWGIAVNSHGEIYVTERYGYRIDGYQVSVFDTNRQKIRTIGYGGASFSDGEFMFPTGIAIDADDNVYIASEHKLQKFNRNGEHVKSVKSSKETQGVKVHNKKLYICDQDNYRVLVYDLELNIIGQYSTRGTGEEAFNRPYDIALDITGNIYITSSDNNQVQVLTQNDIKGHFLRQFGEEKLSKPRGIHIVGDYVYVSDQSKDHIIVFRTSGEFVTTIGEKFATVYGITTDSNGSLYVCVFSKNHCKIL